MTIRPLSMLTACLFFMGGFFLVLPTQEDSATTKQARTETALTGFSPLDGESLRQGQNGLLRFEPFTQDVESSSQSQTSRRDPASETRRQARGSKTPQQRKKPEVLGKLRGRVIWEKSRIPVSGVSMRLYVRIDGEDSCSLTAPEELDAPGSAYILIGEGSCDGKGEFELESRACKGQICVVVCTGEDRVGVFSLSMAPQRGEVFDLGDLSLEETGKALGRVLDADGKPLKNAWVRVASANTLLDYELDGLLLIREPEQRIVPVPEWVRQGHQSPGAGRSRTDEQGFFVVDRVAAGPAKLSVQADQHLPHKMDLEITAGQSSDLGEISMGDGLTLQGQLLDQRGLPVREAQVSVGSSGRSLSIPNMEAHVMSRPVFTDENGRFRVAGLAEGELFVAWRPSSEFDWQIEGPFHVSDELRLKVFLPFMEARRGLGAGVPDGGAGGDR